MLACEPWSIEGVTVSPGPTESTHQATVGVYLSLQGLELGTLLPPDFVGRYAIHFTPINLLDLLRLSDLDPKPQCMDVVALSHPSMSLSLQQDT